MSRHIFGAVACAALSSFALVLCGCPQNTITSNLATGTSSDNLVAVAAIDPSAGTPLIKLARTTDNSSVTCIPVSGAGGPGQSLLIDCAVTPDGSTLLATDEFGARLVFVDLREGREVASVATPGHLAGVVISPDGGTAYATSYDAANVVEIDVAARAVTGVLHVANAGQLLFADLSPDGKYLFVGCGLASVGLTVVDTASLSVLKQAALPRGMRAGWRPAVSPDGNIVWLSDFAGSSLVAAFQAQPPFNEFGTIDTHAVPIGGIDVAPDGRVYVAAVLNLPGNPSPVVSVTPRIGVVVLNPTSFTVESTFESGELTTLELVQLRLTHDGAIAYLSTGGAGVISFDCATGGELPFLPATAAVGLAPFAGAETGAGGACPDFTGASTGGGPQTTPAVDPRAALGF